MAENKTQEIQEIRNYDIAQTGLVASSIGTQTPKNETKKFCWSADLIRNISAIFASTFLSAIGYGILASLIAFRLEANIENEVLISLSSATQIAAGIIFARFLPHLGKKYGLINTLYVGTALSATCALLFYFYVDYFIWIALIFAFGTSLFIVGITRQTVTIDLAPPHFKAMIISLSSMLVALGNAVGPIFLNLLKTGDSLTSCALASLFYVLSILPLNRLRKLAILQMPEEKRIGILRYIKNSPKIMLAGFCVNYSMSAASTFLIIYGIKIGMPKNDAALLYSVLLFGTVFSIPIGYLTDVINKRFMMIFSAFLALICAILLFLNTDYRNIYFLLFLAFGCMVGVKLPALVLINEKYKPTQRLAVNAAFAKFSLMGNIVGIFTTGAIMKIFGPKGLWLSLILIFLSFIIFCKYNYWRKFAKGELDFKKNLNDLKIFFGKKKA